MRALAEIRKLHMLDVETLSNLTWQKVTDVTIAGPRILPMGQKTDITSQF